MGRPYGNKNAWKHGYYGTRLYNVYQGIKQRCYNKNSVHYPDYGARGITVCDEWRNSNIAFFKWAIANGYDPALSIDRIDVNGDYSPENCRWATNSEQQNNRRNNRLIVWHGEKHTIAEWAKIKGMQRTTLQKRLKYGWSIEKALTQPVQQKRRREHG